MSDINQRCALCAIPAKQHCSGCRLVFYCNRDHQKQHWKKEHKLQCTPYKVQTTDALGRHLVATRDIQQGEIIIKETPLILAPKPFSYPTCLGCYKYLKPTENSNYYKCSKCGWPMCREECELSENHIKECELMQKVKYRASIDFKGEQKQEIAYCVIAPLRCFLLDKERMDTLLQLQSHLEERKESPLYKVLFKTNLVPFIQKILALNYDEETILNIAAILDTNAFEVRNSNNVKIRGVYPKTAMVSHSCIANTKHVFQSENFMLVLIATVPILKNELITTTYTQTLWNTLERRKHLKMSKCFDCVCRRCQDSTEFGTYLSAIYCSKCQLEARDTVPMVISMNPLDEKASWKCESCDHKLPYKQIVSGNEDIRKEISKLNKSSPKPLEEFIMKYAETLHPTNTHILEIKYALTQMYGNIPGFRLSEMNDAALERKISLCHELLDISEKLDPGWSRFRGCLLLDLQSAMAFQAKRDFNNDKITKEAAQDIMNESMIILQEVARILAPEPDMKCILQERMEYLANQLDFN